MPDGLKIIIILVTLVYELCCFNVNVFCKKRCDEIDTVLGEAWKLSEHLHDKQKALRTRTV